MVNDINKLIIATWNSFTGNEDTNNIAERIKYVANTIQTEMEYYIALDVDAKDTLKDAARQYNKMNLKSIKATLIEGLAQGIEKYIVHFNLSLGVLFYLERTLKVENFGYIYKD